MTAPAAPRPHEALLEDLRTRCGRTVVVDSELEHRALAHDASHYLLQPAAVVRPGTADDVAAVLRTVARHGAGLTFRSGGTSLSGQAVTDQVLGTVHRTQATEDEVEAMLAARGLRDLQVELRPDPIVDRRRPWVVALGRR